MIYSVILAGSWKEMKNEYLKKEKSWICDYICLHRTLQALLQGRAASTCVLVSTTDSNPYNIKTREILGSFADMELPVGEGKVIFPKGNALKYFAEYFTDEFPENPYAEDLLDVRCVSFDPNGDVLGGNVYERDIMEIIKDYVP